MKTTKIIINYGNSACIPTGVPYEQIKPFYNISEEIEVGNGISDNDISLRIDMLKSIVNEFIFEDIRKAKRKNEPSDAWKKGTKLETPGKEVFQ